MSDRKMSWLKFWPDDYQGSERVRLMTIAQDWAYFHLILHCARNGSVPACPKRAAALLGKGVVAEDVAVALEAFEPLAGDTSRMAHPRVLRERDAVGKFSEHQKEKAAKRWGNATAMPDACHGNATAMPDACHGNATAMPDACHGNARALAQEAEAEAEAYSNTNLALERDARGERAEQVDHSAWIAREIAALPPAWSPALRAKWAEWLAHLIEREQRKHPANDAVLCRPTTSALDAHRRTLSPLPDDATRAAWLETAIGAGLSRPAEPTSRASAGARNQPGAFRAATVQERENF